MACFGELGLAAAPIEERHIELLLQILDLQAHGRLRHIEAVGRLLEAALAGNRPQDAQLIKSEGQISHAEAQEACKKSNSRSLLGQGSWLGRISPLHAPPTP